LEVTARTLGATRVIAVAGEIDLSSIADVQAHIDAAFADGETLLVIDLARVGFVDSSVLHTLFRTLRRARRAGGDIAVVCVDPPICRLLDVFGLSSEVEICRTVEDAALALAGREVRAGRAKPD
jgi:anti-sigma B factor antagonist